LSPTERDFREGWLKRSATNRDWTTAAVVFADLTRDGSTINDVIAQITYN